MLCNRGGYNKDGKKYLFFLLGTNIIRILLWLTKCVRQSERDLA